jgi:glycosyltransferase involved in cell wall biosynthesis
MLIHGATDNDIHPARFGGAQRSFGLFRGLARTHDVRVLCVVPNRTGAAADERIDGVVLARRKAWYTSLAWRLERARIAPLFLAAHAHAARRRALSAALPGTPDVLMADLHLAGLFANAGGALRVLHAHNVEYDHFRAAGPGLGRAWADRLRALEGRAVAAADLVVAASDEDAARLGTLYGVGAERLDVAPNGYDEREARPATAEARVRARAALGIRGDAYVALFMGSDVPHNRAALALLTERVMPALAGEIRLMVVGGVTRALGGRREPWLIAHGETDDMATVFAAADAGLNPVVAGGGSNIKLPTALAAGLAVITTPHGTRGFAPLVPHVVVAAPDAFAGALRARPRGWGASGGPAPAALADYAWGTIGERLGAAFESARGEPARGDEAGARRRHA